MIASRIATVTVPAWLMLTSSVLAQSLVPATARPATAISVPAEAAARTQAKAADASAGQQAKEAERLQKIQQLQFDRRPSAILKAWSEEELKAIADPDKDSPVEAPVPQTDAERFDAQLAAFKRDVTLGNWPAVKQFLASLDKDQAKAAYKKLLAGLQSAPVAPLDLPDDVRQRLQQMQQMLNQRRGQAQRERNVISFGDLLALADAAPNELDDVLLANLGGLARLAIQNGNVVEHFVDLLHREAAKPDDEAVLTRRQSAKVLTAAGHARLAGDFLPEIETAVEENDHEALNLLSRHYLALHAEEKKVEHLKQAWRVTQAVLASSGIEKKQKQEALKRAVDLAPKIEDEVGRAWLLDSFTEQPVRGMEILAAIGTSAATSMQRYARNPAVRLKGLQLQTTAVEALLEASGERAEAWGGTLNLLAHNWLREAVHAYKNDDSTSLGPRLERDPFGNYFYVGRSYGSYRSSNQAQAIKTGDLLEIKPSVAWLALLREGLKPKFDMIYAQLYLKVAEEDRAFPYIERLAESHPERAKDLVDEFLRVWTTNHDPNADRNRTNPYMYLYGFTWRAESIPLTRSKQERNLQELSELVKRLNALGLGELNEELLSRAFTTCHSQAEVYRLENIEKVFGPIDNLEPETLAELAQQMRANLAGLWREPAVQKQNQTRRKQKDIQLEVFRGYRVARTVVENALAKHPENWALQLAKASIEHDENNFRRQIEESSEFSERRDVAFDGFRKAAQLYAQDVAGLPEDEQTTKIYELWFYASLGACDLGQINEKSVPDRKQPKRIREAILALPGEAAERHMSMFASTLFTRMSNIKPEVKFRYLKGGFEITGDHKQAHQARKVYDYYKDLVTEIQLEAAIDGSDVVGHERPFGVFVNIRHTREIEREAGGFGRYLQNQNAGTRYYYNYGRPTADYRDKFEELTRQALGEHFEVLSITFESEDVNSKAVEEYGWRVTPYAYLLLKARGPEVDTIPPLELHLDFLDTTGYVILPVESAAVPVDATPETGDPRPVQDLSITQILDERQADEGKLVLEVKATGHGLIPELDEILDVDPEGFEVVETDDQGLAVSRFDPETEQTLVLSERTWMIAMQASRSSSTPATRSSRGARAEAEGSGPPNPEAGASGSPNPEADASGSAAVFRFPAVKIDDAEVVYQRYVDADLVEAERVVSLEREYASAGYRWAWIPVLAVLAVVGVLIVLRALRRRPREREEARFRMPERVTPFTVLGLLRDIQQNNGLSDPERQELCGSIDRLERLYFADADGSAAAPEPAAPRPDLAAVAETWVRKTEQ